MDMVSSWGLREKLQVDAKKFGLLKDPIYMSILDRYVKLVELQSKYFEDAKDPEKLNGYLALVKEANTVTNQLQRRVTEVCGKSPKYDQELESYREAAKRNYEKRCKEVDKYWNSKFNNRQRELESKLKESEKQISQADKALNDRIESYNRMRNDIDERITEARREKDQALKDLNTVKKELEALQKEKRAAIRELEDLDTKLEGRRGRYNKVKEAEEEANAPEPEVDPNGL
jgi:chromosome segregation ATPase